MLAVKATSLAALVVALSFLSSATAAIPAELHPKRHLFENTHKREPSRVRRQSSSTPSYPPAFEIPSPSLLPSSWRAALQSAISAGKIPDIPRSTVTANGGMSYPAGTSERAIGSWTNSKILGPNDISEAPDGVWGVNFDDGPTNESPPLYRYLESVNQSATHFLIGSNIVAFPDAFSELAEGDQQLAVHTWSHSLQTSRTNEEILGELGWNMQIIFDRSGKIPNLWRPPQGDVDNRVRAIAEEVLGLQCALWQADSNDWCLNDQFQSTCTGNPVGASYNTVRDYIQSHVEGPKSPGIILLEHEIRAPSISLFRGYYPTLRDNGWTPEPIGNFDQAKAWYNNAINASTPVSGQTGVLLADKVSSTSSISTSTTGASTVSSSSTSSATSGSQSGGTTNASLPSAASNQAVWMTASLAMTMFLAVLAL